MDSLSWQDTVVIPEAPLSQDIRFEFFCVKGWQNLKHDNMERRLAVSFCNICWTFPKIRCMLLSGYPVAKISVRTLRAWPSGRTQGKDNWVARAAIRTIIPARTMNCDKPQVRWCGHSRHSLLLGHPVEAAYTGPRKRPSSSGVSLRQIQCVSRWCSGWSRCCKGLYAKLKLMVETKDGKRCLASRFQWGLWQPW